MRARRRRRAAGRRPAAVGNPAAAGNPAELRADRSRAVGRGERSREVAGRSPAADTRGAGPVVGISVAVPAGGSRPAAADRVAAPVGSRPGSPAAARSAVDPADIRVGVRIRVVDSRPDRIHPGNTRVAGSSAAVRAGRNPAVGRRSVAVLGCSADRSRRHRGWVCERQALTALPGMSNLRVAVVTLRTSWSVAESRRLQSPTAANSNGSARRGPLVADTQIGARGQ